MPSEASVFIIERAASASSAWPRIASIVSGMTIASLGTWYTRRAWLPSNLKTQLKRRTGYSREMSSPRRPAGLLGPHATGVLPTGAVPPYDAVIFDMDGVVTDTAGVHAAAWQELFDAVLADSRADPSANRAHFDIEADYRRYVDGRSREDGVAAFLTARGINLPTGTSDDPPSAWTVWGLAARKNELFLTRLAEHGLRVFEGTLALLRRLRAGGVPVGLVTASRNADALLASANLADLFGVVVDGTVAAALGLHGKPDPATFLEAARRLGVTPPRAAVVEDATTGVEAARRGGFGLVVGIDRAGRRDELEAAGADLVLADVALLDLGALPVGPWLLAYEGFDPAHEGHREALTTLGNGYFATRGAAPERIADGVHYPGTYLAGVYNRLISEVQGRRQEDESMVNAPNWLVFDLRVGDGEWWSTGGMQIASERRELDLRRGVLTRRAVLTDEAGRRLRLTQRRLVSMARPHLAAIETTLVADGWSGSVSVRAGVDAGVANANVAEYRALAAGHLIEAGAREVGTDTLLVEVETSQSRVRIAIAARTTVSGLDTEPPRHFEAGAGMYAHRLELVLSEGQPLTIDKTVAIVTSRDPAIASPAHGALSELERAPAGVNGLLPGHEAAWERLWGHFEIELEADDRHTQLVLNLHILHLVQTISPHTGLVDAGVGARGLHGEGYRGHVFWDELFVMPVITPHLPSASRALLEYRWRRLDAARRAAQQAGLTGAMFPWQSGSDGREETPRELFNLRSGRWMADRSSRQRHVGLAVAYNAWQYYQANGDATWLAERGAELIVEVARLFASLATHDPADDRYHIAGVMGPDEYHDGYPDASGAGLRDNAYTNVLAAWVCDRAVDAVSALGGPACDDVGARLKLDADEPEAWRRLSRRLAVPFHADGVISQFAGYEALAEFDWAAYRARYGNIGRLDLILEAEGDTTNRYRLSKQADVLMLIYLLGPDELVGLLGRLGYDVSPESLARTVDYYVARTAHGSTLSRVVHASVLARLDPSRAWSIFRDALAADLDDTQGGTTQEGIHLGAMAGTIDIATRAFAGLRTEGDILIFDPRLPTGLRRARFVVHHRRQRIEVALDHERLRFSVHPCSAPGVRVRVGTQTLTLDGGETYEIRLSAAG
jgi:beta-phosphoglucomutase family hydrolase